MQLIDMFYKEFEDAKARRVPFVIPIGTMEYHAHHASCGCDTMVITGILERLERRKEIVVCPPIWYGVSSYAVSGPEKGTIHVDADAYEAYIYQILKSMVFGGHKNIYCVYHHQSEGDGLKPMSLACMKAAQKVIFAYLEENRGYGWWGEQGNESYYQNLGSADDPFRYIKVIQLADEKTQTLYGGFDHAGKYETSLLWALYPNHVDEGRMRDNTEWFTRSAPEATKELGEHMARHALNWLERAIV
ncbi:MAG TPA: creatininase family protein [Feifaniaceae bacterium]|nr:creatininase family protein [Feifaniaceae bacterium]